MSVVAAHTQRQTLRLVECYPAHEPRRNDKHYEHFAAARRRLQRMGKLVCQIGNSDCDGGIELHHSVVEFSLANGVDVNRFGEIFPEFGISTDEQFLNWVEGPGNLTPLCVAHHRGRFGIHCMPYPLWEVQRFWQAGLDAPAHTE